MKKVNAIPPLLTAGPRANKWLEERLDGSLWEIEREDWEPHYSAARSAASAMRESAELRGYTAITAVRGDMLYFQATPNGTKPAPVRRVPRKRAAKSAVATRTKAPTKKAATKK